VTSNPLSRRTHLRAPCRIALTSLLIWTTIVAAAPAQEPQGHVLRAPSRVRPADPEAARILRRGYAASATFARLLAAVDKSDLIVHVETSYLRVPGRLQVVCARPGARFVRITLNVPESEALLVSWLAHELQHAIEIAGAPEVTDAVTQGRFFERTGHRISDDGYCTAEAQRTREVVLYEVQASLAANR
jgi:hypothetical protein